MLRNYLAAALRNLVRNKLYAMINIIGLAVGFTAALLIALYVTDEYSYDSWIPGHDRIYSLSVYMPDGRRVDMTSSHIAAWLKEEAPQVAAVARLAPINAGLPGMPLRHDDNETLETAFYWGDASFFDVVPLPVVAGDPKAALGRPDGIVLTLEAARRLFGRDAPLGETLLVDGSHPMIVGAVIEDLPLNSQFAIDVIASGKAPFSELARDDADPNPLLGSAYTYVWLAPGASEAEFSRLLPQVIDRHMGTNPDGRKASERYGHALPITAVHLSRGDLNPMKPRGDPGGLLAMVFVGVLIVVVASLNFVGLTTARAATRSLEVAVRKACGAQRWQLTLQFLGETIIAAAFGSIVALIAATLLKPSFAALVGGSLAFTRFWTPETIVAGSAFVLGVAIAAGGYPAFVIAAFRPAITLRGTDKGPGAWRLRQTFVIFQFAVLVGLVLATLAIHRQVLFAEDQAMRFDKSQVLLVDTSCTGSFPEAVRSLPGVQDARCSGWMLAGQDIIYNYVHPDGTRLTLPLMNAAPGLFELYGIRPTAGRLFADTDTKALILNEAAVRYLGYPSDEAVIGEYPFGEERGQVIGVIPDTLMRSVRDPVKPTVYPVGFPGQRRPFSVLSVKLRGDRLPETLRAIDETWHATGDRPGPISRRFFDQYVQSLYMDTTRQGALFGVFAGVAIFLASLGLFGLAAFTAERRTKEIGIRKAMGASKADILRLVLWEFTKPVLWANVIAWPVGYFVMHRWLEGFAYHVDLSPWVFLAASALALVIAVATVSGHALLIARSQPVTALRYE